MLHDPRLLDLRDRLTRHAPQTAGDFDDLGRAAVALIVRPDAHDLELLLIRRAERVDDPWSGHMALPGGRVDPADAHTMATAIRETAEEVGVDLSPDAALGRLDDVLPASGAPRVAVSVWAFAVPAATFTSLNYEVDAALWVPLSHLSSPGAAIDHLHALTSGETLRFPAFEYREHVIWGLTHRIITQFLELAGRTDQRGEMR